ncbi:hypothetical protein VM1G_00260 [Cytospora mali]|uniref:Uncharacterized protein n=1 Tax=Cytospora mali TaxID=578113 RepID=A0A194VNI0_CYTMA|nr:hypothetical protein VM1G_00260 [Valsa mali]
MKTNILLLLVAAVTAALAAALNEGNAVAANPVGKDEIVPRGEDVRTIYITTLKTIHRASLLRPTTSYQPYVVETAYIHETVWSNPTLGSWTTLGTTTEVPASFSTSTTFTTIQVIAESVSFTTTTLHRRSPGVANVSSSDAVETPPPNSSVVVGTPVSASSAPEESLPPPMLSAPVSSTITTVFPLRSDTTGPPPFLPPVSNTSDTAPSATWSFSEIPPLSGSPVPATTLMTSVVPPPAPTPAPASSDFSCVDSWCSDDSSSYCLYWGGMTAENSVGEPLPGMVLTHLGGCALSTATLSDGLATTMYVSVPAPITSVDPANTPPSAGPGATPAPFSGAGPSIDLPPPGVTAALGPRGRGRI